MPIFFSMQLLHSGHDEYRRPLKYNASLSPSAGFDKR